MDLPVTITSRAITEIKNIIQHKGIPENYGLRIGIKGGGCGASLVLGFDQKMENDLEFKVQGIHIFMQKRETMFLIGKELDFYDGADQRGFAFI